MYSFKPHSFPPIRVHRELGFTGLTLCKVSGRLAHHLVAICGRKMVSVLRYHISLSQVCCGLLWIEIPIYLHLHIVTQSVITISINGATIPHQSNIKTYAPSLILPFISTFLSNLSAKCCQFYLLNMYVSDWNAFLLLHSQPKNPSLHLTQNILPNWSPYFPSSPFHTQCPTRRQELLKRKSAFQGPETKPLSLAQLTSHYVTHVFHSKLSPTILPLMNIL